MSDRTIGFLFKINDLQKNNRYDNYSNFIESTSEPTFKLIQMIDYFYKRLNLNLNYENKIFRIGIYLERRI